MAKPMSPSDDQITAGQAAKFIDVAVAKLRKSGLPSAPTQQVLESQADQLAANFVADVRKRVDAISDMIVRRVTVVGTRTPQAAIDATGRNKYVDRKSVTCMPGSASGEMDVHFFKVSRFISDADLEKEYELRGLVPNPLAQAAVNEADPAFADEYPNVTHWQDADGNWHYASFYQWLGLRYVCVSRSDGDWGDHWFFGGVRKV